MSRDRVSHRAGLVIEALRRHRHDDAARRVERLAAEAADTARSEDALNELMDLCHIRALGDLYVPSLTLGDWLKRLEHLHRACRKELKRRGKEDRESRRRREEGRALARPKAAGGPPGTPPTDGAAPGGGHGNGAPRDFDGGNDDSGPAAMLISGAAALLALVALYAALRIAMIAPEVWPPDTVSVSGAFQRTEVSGGAYHARRLGRSARTIFLDGNAVAFRIPNPGATGWHHASARLKRGDRLKMLVERDAYARARAEQDRLRAATAAEQNLDRVGQLVARSVIEGRRNPVRVLEIRRGDEVIYSRLVLLPNMRQGLAMWAGAVAVALLALFGLLMLVRRRRVPAFSGAATVGR